MSWAKGKGGSGWFVWGLVNFRRVRAVSVGDLQETLVLLGRVWNLGSGLGCE